MDEFELSDIQVAEFKIQLYALKQSLLEDLADTNHATDTVELDQQSVGRLSRMDAMQMQQMALETQRRNVQRLKDVEHALLKWQKGDYGLCETCGAFINPKRLVFNPTVKQCIDCAE